MHWKTETFEAINVSLFLMFVFLSPVIRVEIGTVVIYDTTNLLIQDSGGSTETDDPTSSAK